MTTYEESVARVLEIPSPVIESVQSDDFNASFETDYRPLKAGVGERFRRTLALISCGHVSATALSMAAMTFTSILFGPGGIWLWDALICLVAVRLVYVLTRGPEPVLRRFLIRKTVGRVLVDETKITVGFLAVAFLLHWPITPTEIAAYVIANTALQLGLLGYSRSVLRFLAGRATHRSSVAACSRTAIIVGTGKQATAVADMLLDSPELDTHVLGFLDHRRTGLWRYRDIPLIGHPDRLTKIVNAGQVNAVLIAVETCDLPNARSILETAEEMGVNSYLLNEIYSPDVAVLRPEFLNGTPALVWRHVKENRFALFVKQAIDRLGALAGLVVMSPLILLTAIAVKLDSAGPVFFTQVRCGRNGRPFNLYKFRTMTVDAETRMSEVWPKNEMSGPVFKLKHDPRVTRLGRILRKFSIDELPQLVNVITGDMSLVGPRPPLPQEVLKFEPWQRRKLSVQPGLTCIWQVSGRNDVGFEDWMRMDLEYIDQWSLWLDARILARTIPTVFKGTGM
ncbi:MAG: sugar transferase [candidate division Zixibacteria bacterium]|nr:sugar transferase [candidate division Zixibacteria bacterium]